MNNNNNNSKGRRTTQKNYMLPYEYLPFLECSRNRNHR